MDTCSWCFKNAKPGVRDDRLNIPFCGRGCMNAWKKHRKDNPRLNLWLSLPREVRDRAEYEGNLSYEHVLYLAEKHDTKHLQE